MNFLRYTTSGIRTDRRTDRQMSQKALRRRLTGGNKTVDGFYQTAATVVLSLIAVYHLCFAVNALDVIATKAKRIRK